MFNFYDRVRYVGNKTPKFKGWEGHIANHPSESAYEVEVQFDNGETKWIAISNLTKISVDCDGGCSQNYSNNNTNKTFMSGVKNLIKRITRSEPTKTLINAGFLDDCENLTCAGKEALELILLEEYSEELLAKAKMVVEYNESQKNK